MRTIDARGLLLDLETIWRHAHPGDDLSIEDRASGGVVWTVCGPDGGLYMSCGEVDANSALLFLAGRLRRDLRECSAYGLMTAAESRRHLAALEAWDARRQLAARGAPAVELPRRPV